MASPIKKAQLSVLDMLKAIPPISGLECPNGKLFQFCNLWNDQLKVMEEGEDYVVGNPAAFPEFIPGQSTTVGQGISMYESAKFRIHILYWELDAGDETSMDQNTTVFDVRDAVIVALNGQKASNCATLSNTGDELDGKHKNMYHYIVEFTTCFIDTKGSPLDPDYSNRIIKAAPVDLIINVTGGDIFNDIFNDVFA